MGNYNDYCDRGEYYDCHKWGEVGYPGEFVYGDDVYIDDFHMDERWLPVREFPDRYWVSTHGRVWSYLENRFVGGSPTGRCGHIDLSLKDYDGNRVHRYMHRLVADAFIPNPDGYPEVLHGPEDDDPSNNCVWNLRWGNQLDNARDCIERGRFRYFTDDDREAAMQKRRTPVTAYNIRTGETIDFISQGEAARELGISPGEISCVVRGEREHVNGWTFCYQGSDYPCDVHDVDLHRHAKLPRIIATNLDTGESFCYRGLTEAAKDLGMSVASVSNVLRGKQNSAKGWIFEYDD